MFAPLGFGQANALMPGRFAQLQQMPGQGLPQQEMQMAAQRGMPAPQFGGVVGAGMAPQMGQRSAPPMMSMMPQQGWMNSPFFRGSGGLSGGGMLGGVGATPNRLMSGPGVGGWVGAPISYGSGGFAPQLGSAAGGGFGGGMPQRPTMGIPEQPNMPGMPQQLGPAYGRGRFGGGGFR